MSDHPKLINMLFLFLAVSIASFFFFSSLMAKPAHSQERKLFFVEAGSARLKCQSPNTVTDCCGEGDWTNGKIIGSRGDQLIYQVTKTGRHKYAKIGETYLVSKCMIMKSPLPPKSVGTGMFISVYESRKDRYGICLGIMPGT